MKIKRAKKGQNRDLDTCVASRCEERDGLVIYAAGVAFDFEVGAVALCPRHVEMRDAERAYENQKAAAQPAPQGSVDAGSFLAQQAAVPALAEEASALSPVRMPGSDVLAAANGEARDAGEVLEMVKQFQVSGQVDIDFANECLGDVKTKLKQLEAKRKEATDPLQKALTTIRGWFKPATDFYSECESLWKLKIRDGMLALQESQRAALAAASVAHKAAVPAQVAQAMVAANAVAVELPANVSIVERWSFRIVDETALPREYLAPDMRKIQGVVDALKGSAHIPGVETYRDDTVVRRA